MQYVRSLGGSVSKTWNSINPATLSGAIDVIVVEQEDGSLACSPFHVRFGKFSLLRPSEKKVEFQVNNVKQGYAMKLGDGGEAFFVFETSDHVPEGLQTSPVISPVPSPQPLALVSSSEVERLQEPDPLNLNDQGSSDKGTSMTHHDMATLVEELQKADAVDQDVKARLASQLVDDGNPINSAFMDPNGLQPVFPRDIKHSVKRSQSDEILPTRAQGQHMASSADQLLQNPSRTSPNHARALARSQSPKKGSDARRSQSPPLLSVNDAVTRARALSQKLSSSNIASRVTETGDLELDIQGYKSSDEDVLHAELIARRLLSEELEGNYDIGALIGADEAGNLWIYSSEEAKEAAERKHRYTGMSVEAPSIDDSASDPGAILAAEDATSGEFSSSSAESEDLHHRVKTDSASSRTSPECGDHPDAAQPPSRPSGEINYAKTLRLTSDQLKALQLRPGINSMSFSVNKATCQAYMHYWRYDVPIVISDIDGTITKSDALGHVLNMLGRDWTHIGVAKLYTEIVANGYNILYLTSRSVGQADTTRAYLNGVFQEGNRLPKGPVILSPDRTIAALRREIYLRKPEVFKMACLRDISGLFSQTKTPFYAGFGNRLTDALSYRSVNIPSSRIFTINSNADISLDLLTLNTYRSSYVTMREIVDHFFPPVGLLVARGDEEYTDFNYWRDQPLDLNAFGSDFESNDDVDDDDDENTNDYDEDEDDVQYIMTASAVTGSEYVESELDDLDSPDGDVAELGLQHDADEEHVDIDDDHDHEEHSEHSNKNEHFEVDGEHSLWRRETMQDGGSEGIASSSNQLRVEESAKVPVLRKVTAGGAERSDDTRIEMDHASALIPSITEHGNHRDGKSTPDEYQDRELIIDARLSRELQNLGLEGD